MHPYRVFTLEQANLVLPRVIEVTSQTQDRLRTNPTGDETKKPGKGIDAEGRTLLSAWTTTILEIGAQPKGLFTVDFRTADPSVVWCWGPDEEEILHRHFAWESFKDRITLEDGKDRWPCRN